MEEVATEEPRHTIRTVIFAETVVRADLELARITEIGLAALDTGDEAVVQEYRVRIAVQKGIVKGLSRLLGTEIPEAQRPATVDGLVQRAYIIHTGKAKHSEG